MRINKLNVVVLVLIFVLPGILSGSEVHEAAEQGDLQKLKTLLAVDPKLLNACDDSQSLLHIAARSGHKEVVLFLLDAGINVNAENDWKQTALHYAARKGYQEIVQILLDNKSHVNGRTKAGDTPLDLAETYEHTGIVNLLKARGGISTVVKEPEIKPITSRVSRVTFDYSLRPNLLVFQGDDGLLIVDTGFKRTGKKLQETLTHMGKGKLKYLVNTHLHGDHNEANVFFTGEKVADSDVIVIHGDNLEELSTKKILEKSKEGMKGKNGSSLPVYYSLCFNGEEIRFIPMPGMHSEQDILVYFPGSGVVHMGDLLLSRSFPSVGRNIPGYLDFLEKVLAIFPVDTVFISGHGVDSSAKEVRSYVDMLGATIQIILEQKKKGKSLEQLREEKILSPYQEYDSYLEWLDTDYWLQSVYSVFPVKK